MKRLRGLKVWFLVSGSIGIIVALVLAIVASSHSLNPKLLLTLWPSSIVGLSDPTTVAANIVIGVYEFGGNFLLYGIIGTGLGFAIRLGSRVRWRALWTRMSSFLSRRTAGPGNPGRSLRKRTARRLRNTPT
jgi:hypothetical protein